MLTVLVHQVCGRGDEVPGVHPGHQADVIAVVHEHVDGNHVPLVFPGVQLQDFFGDNLMAI